MMRHTTSTALPAPKKLQLMLLAAGLCSALFINKSHAATYAGWLTQIGETDQVLAAANWGKGQLLGVVDTGINPSSAYFATGQVSTTLSKCAAVSFRCSNGYLDDNSHGTAVAEIAAGNKTSLFNASYGGYTTKAGSVISVAPNANIVAEKVLNASGSGYDVDVANGIISAANAGAGVINVSITYGNTASLVNAINYAASKGSFIVWAGGNSATTLLGGANTNGLTAAAISRLVFVGSVNSANQLSSFSNTPGAGSLSGTSYASRWVMAPGEAIIAPYTTAGTSAWSYWSGTSMAAPIVSGAMVLLQSAWPILKTRGTTANLLIASTNDLGTAGVDNRFGNGIINLTKAFQPSGALTVSSTSGTSYTVSSLTGKMITSGALGTFSAIQSKLANYTALDGYSRNFTVNLSGLVSSKPTGATLNPLPTNVNSGPAVIKLRDGAVLELQQSPSSSVEVPGNFLASEQHFGQQPVTTPGSSFAMLSRTTGETLGMGFSAPVAFGFSKALSGNRDTAILHQQLQDTGVTPLAASGVMAAYGTPLTARTRLAVALSGSSKVAHTALNPGESWQDPSAQLAKIGISSQLGQQVQTSIAIGQLRENHGLLGSTYDTDSALGFGSRNRSQAVEWSLAVQASDRTSLLFTATTASTPSVTGNGLLSGSTKVKSQGFGVSLMTSDVREQGDKLSFSLKQPLRVTQGSLSLANTVIDPDTGEPSVVNESVSLVPTGRQIDYRLAYTKPLGKRGEWNLEIKHTRDDQHIAGAKDTSIGATWSFAY